MSWSPDAVEHGYCGDCREVTRIEGLRVQLHWRAGEWECKPCSLSFNSPHGHSWPPSMCGTCGRAMSKRLHAEVTVPVGGLSPEAREQAETYVGCRVSGSLLTDLRSLPEGGAAWYEQARHVLDPDSAAGRAVARPEGDGMSLAPRVTGRDYYRLVYEATRGPQSAAARARALLDRMRRRQPPEPAVRGPGAPGVFWDEIQGWDSLILGDGSREFIFDVPQQSYEELAAETMESLRRFWDLSVTVSGTFTAEQFAAAAGQDLTVTGTSITTSPDSPLGALTPAEIDRLLGSNQTVMEGLILNHYRLADPDKHEIPWSDPASWSPGDTEL